MTVKTRFAPSPTGYLHIGGVRTALFSWAFARHHKGEFLLRIEDTDLARSTAESVNIILDGMKWVGLNYDNADNVVYQTRRFDRYKEVIAELLEKGHAYFCDSVSETNLEISALKEFWDIFSHKMFKTPKAQTHIYKFRQVDNVNLAAILGFGYASDGVKVYHEGKELEGANASKMRYIEQVSGRKSVHFTTDGENVYYDSKKLGIKFSPQMRDIGEIWRIHYLYEPNSGMVYANDHEFDPKFAPYEPLFNLKDEHSYHALFRGKGGIYHWERKWQWYNSIDEGEFVRDGDDPFKGEITPLYGDVVISEGKTYFLKTYEIWHNTKQNHSLSSRHTCIVRLDTKEQWRKIGLVRNDGYGAVYANGDKTYYFDNVGYGWHFNSSVYDINDLGVVEILTRPYGPNVENLKLDEIVKMVDQGAMVPAEGEVVIDAISDFDDYSQKYAYWIFLAIAFILSVVGAIFKNKKQKSELKKRVDDYR